MSRVVFIKWYEEVQKEKKQRSERESVTTQTTYCKSNFRVEIILPKPCPLPHPHSTIVINNLHHLHMLALLVPVTWTGHISCLLIRLLHRLRSAFQYCLAHHRRLRVRGAVSCHLERDLLFEDGGPARSGNEPEEGG